MRRKGSLIRIQAIREVRASLATFGAGVVERLDARRPAPPAGEPAFTYQVVFDDLDRELAAVQERLVTEEDAHMRNRIRRSNLNRTVEALTTALYERLVSTRRTLRGAFGPQSGFELAAVEGSTPEGTVGLLNQVDQTIKLLREPEVELPAVTIEGVDITLDAVAAGLENGLQELESVQADLEQARKAVSETVIERGKAIDEYDQVFPWVARALESYFRLAGELKLADRIRTSARRVTRRQAVDVEPGDTDEPSIPDASEVAGDEAAPSESAEVIPPTSNA